MAYDRWPLGQRIVHQVVLQERQLLQLLQLESRKDDDLLLYQDVRSQANAFQDRRFRVVRGGLNGVTFDPVLIVVEANSCFPLRVRLVAFVCVLFNDFYRSTPGSGVIPFNPFKRLYAVQRDVYTINHDREGANCDGAYVRVSRFEIFSSVSCRCRFVC